MIWIYRVQGNFLVAGQNAPDSGHIRRTQRSAIGIVAAVRTPRYQHQVFPVDLRLAALRAHVFLGPFAMLAQTFGSDAV